MQAWEITKRIIGGEQSSKMMPIAEREPDFYHFVRPISDFRLPSFSQVRVLFDPGKISLIGAIFYDTRHAHVKHILGNNGYWNSLDSETRLGPGWDVYALGMSKTDPDPDFDQVKSEILSCLEEYGMEQYFDRLPFFVFLSQTKRPDGFFHNLCIRLSDDSPEKAFDSLRKVIRTATTAIKNVERENYSRSEEIFYLVESEFRNQSTWRHMSKMFSIYDKLKSFIA
jgi:hypothetical protein